MTDDAKNVLVLTIFAGSVIAVIVGYLLAWRSQQTVSRRIGSLMVASIAGFAGFVISAWLMGAVMPLPPPDGEPIWEPLLFLLVLSPLPVGAFCLCGKFVRRAYRTNEIEKQSDETQTEIRPKQREYRRESVTMLVSCVACALTWWWWTTRTLHMTGSERLNPLLSDLAGVLNFPGWLVVMMFDPRESPMLPATKLTDTLIPLLSGLFWTLLALLLVRLSTVFRRYVHLRYKS